jgi:simple sugar transport system ATP-binding protein
MTSPTGPPAGGERGSPPAVELIGITKRFGQVTACDGVDLALHRGHVHGILGENGAGKSTLMKVLIGLVLPDAGQIRLHGVPVQIVDPIDAAARGIGMVHQHLSLVEPLTVWENVALGDVGHLDPRRVRQRVAEISEQYGLQIDPDDRIAELPAGMRQRVEIIKCLRRDPDVLVFDEPTSLLTPAESDFLFAALRRVVDEEQRAVALVSHKLPEVLAAADQITIMRDGRVVDSRAAVDSDVASLARAMVGREVSLRGEHSAFGLVAEEPDLEPVSPPATRPDQASGRNRAGVAVSPAPEAVPALRIRGASLRGRDGRILLDELALDVQPGEIVGLAGVEGNGQRVLGDVLSSLLALDAGSVEVDGRAVESGRAGAMAAAGVAVIPEDRHDSGCVLDFTVAENLFLTDPHRVARRGLMDHRRMRDEAAELIERFSIACQGPDAPMWSLSGGNQQRE